LPFERTIVPPSSRLTGVLHGAHRIMIHVLCVHCRKMLRCTAEGPTLYCRFICFCHTTPPRTAAVRSLRTGSPPHWRGTRTLAQTNNAQRSGGTHTTRGGGREWSPSHRHSSLHLLQHVPPGRSIAVRAVQQDAPCQWSGRDSCNVHSTGGASTCITVRQLTYT
jgi:hypothetical protein